MVVFGYLKEQGADLPVVAPAGEGADRQKKDQGKHQLHYFMVEPCLLYLTWVS